MPIAYAVQTIIKIAIAIKNQVDLYNSNETALLQLADTMDMVNGSLLGLSQLRDTSRIEAPLTKIQACLAEIKVFIETLGEKFSTSNFLDGSKKIFLADKYRDQIVAYDAQICKLLPLLSLALNSEIAMRLNQMSIEANQKEITQKIIPSPQILQNQSHPADSRKLPHKAPDNYDFTLDEPSIRCEVFRKPKTERIQKVPLPSKTELFSAPVDLTLTHFHTFEAHPRSISGYGINALCALPHNRLAVTAKDPVIKIWDVTKNCYETTLETRADLILSLPENRIATGATRGTININIWEIHTNHRLVTFEGHKSAISDIEITPNGQLVSGAREKSQAIRIWDTRCGGCVNVLDACDYVTALQVLPNGMLISGNCNGQICIWDPRSTRCVQTIEEKAGEIQKIRILNDYRIATSTFDYKIRIWNIGKQEFLTVLEGHTSSIHDLLLFSNDILVSTGQDKTIRTWDISQNQCRMSITAVDKNFVILQKITDGSLVTTGWRNVSIWGLGHPSKPKSSQNLKSVKSTIVNEYSYGDQESYRGKERELKSTVFRNYSLSTDTLEYENGYYTKPRKSESQGYRKI